MKKFRWWAIGGVLLLTTSVFIYLHHYRTVDEQYREVSPIRGEFEVAILSTGSVAPENRLEIKPPIAGRVEEVLVNEGQTVRKGQILAWMSSTERAALLDAARSRGDEEFKRWKELYRPTPIMAPLSGLIILRNVEPGQSFTSTDSVFSMSDRLTVKAQVDETDIAQIHLKQKAKIILDAYSSQSISATVDQIAFDAKTVNNVTTYIVDVLPDETPGFMRSGMTANVKFIITSKQNALTLPSDSFRTRDNKYYVLLKSSEKKPVEKEVVIGLTNGKATELLSGLNEKDVVLISESKWTGTKPTSGINPFSPMGTSRRIGH